MGGVNLVEESRNILAANAGVMLGQLRSCKDESFLDNATLASRISAVGEFVTIRMLNIPSGCY